MVALSSIGCAAARAHLGKVRYTSCSIELKPCEPQADISYIVVNLSWFYRMVVDARDQG